MVIKDKFTVNVPVETVWSFLHDIPRVSSCMPGAEEVEEVESDVYSGKLKARVGAVRAAFDGQVMIDERVAPERLVASIKAEERSLASYVDATFTSHLTPVEAGTQIDYEIDVTLRGRLAQMGYAPVRQAVKKMTAEFATCLQESLTAT